METALQKTLVYGFGKSEKTRIHNDTWPTVRKIINVGGIQVAVYTIFNTLLWYALPYTFNVLPKEVPTLLEFVCDLSTTIIISDFLIFLNHFMHQKVKYLYKKVHYIHHQFRNDMFSWCAGWVHCTPSRSQLLSSLWCYTRGYCFQ